MDLFEVTFDLNISLINGETENEVRVSAGTHLMQRIPNPAIKGHSSNWLVLKGSKVGLSELALRREEFFTGLISIVSVDETKVNRKR